MAQQPRPSSIVAVARHAGVSPATVSRVMTGQQRHIAAATRAKVLAAATALDYIPNHLARSLATRRVPLVAAIVHDIADPYFGEATRGIESVAGEQDHMVMVCTWLRDPARLIRYLRLLRAMRVAGVIFCGSGLVADEPLSREASREIRTLRLYGMQMLALAPQPVPMPAMMIDNREAARMAVRHLIEHGHRRIGHLAGPRMLITAQHRREGYLDALRGAGIAPQDAWVEPAGFQMAEGFEACRRLLQRAPELTAILASNDQAAIGAIAAAAEAARRVPEDLSIIGIGDAPGSAYSLPGLTTVAVPTRTLGEEGARWLLRRVRAGTRGTGAVRVLPVRLVVRGSVAMPPTVALAADGGAANGGVPLHHYPN